MKKIFFFIIILFVGILIYLTFYFDEKSKNQFDDFYSSEISGKIEKLYAGSSGVHITINNEVFVFKPVTSKLNDFRIFDQNANIGDFIEKPAFADTLTLIKKDETIFYTFQMDYFYNN
ncbi:MAG: hypothetical protein KDC85_11190 [Saprospiraceae bacterium]|nr:hypothetical protein [Saprospiraceae bacterium]MCB9322399.1 hypothetical protein [Lewinellaceae bacterium]